MSIWNDIEKALDDAGRFLGGVFHSLLKTEVVALQPIVTSVVANATADIATAAATGKLSEVGAVLGALVNQTIVQVEATGVSAGIQSIGTTVAAALAEHPAVVAMAQTPAAIPPAPSQVAEQPLQAAGTPIADTAVTSAVTPEQTGGATD